MKRFFSIVIVLLACCLMGPDLYAQYETEEEATIPLDHFYIKRQRPGLRKFLSKFTFGLSTGFALTNFQHEVTGFSLRQPASGSPMIFQSAATTGYSNWFNRVTSAPLPAGTTFSDQEDISFKAKAFHIPLRATLHFEFQRFRIGGGYSFEYTNIGDFESQDRSDISSFSHDANSFFLKRYFGLLGATVYRYEEYLLVVEANVGGYKLGKKFDGGAIDRSLFFNFGASIEREMSEYFRLFIRPSYDFKNFAIAVPETGNSIRHRFNTFYINVGATYRIPELRRCFLKQCHAQLNHAHGNREYRSRRHPIWKKQNPHYGENYPNLIKYKGRNKKKLNPY